MLKKEFTVFNNKKVISIDLILLTEFESKVGKFNEITAQRYCDILELNECMSNDDLSRQVMELMKEDCGISELFKNTISDEKQREDLLNVNI